MADNLPRRLAEAQATAATLPQEAFRVFESGKMCGPANEERLLEDSLTINVWKDAEGRSCFELVSHHTMSSLEAKGLLHDALYALASADHNPTRARS